MADFGKVQGTTTVTLLGQGNKFEKRTFQSGDTAVIKLASEPKKEENVYKTMGMSLSSFDERAAEPQGETTAAAGANVSVGDKNGTTIIIIGNGNNVNVGAAGKTDDVDDVDDVDETEDPDEVENPDEAEEPAEEKPAEDKNKTIIDVLKEIIIKLLELIAPSAAEEPAKTEEPTVEEPEEPAKTEEPEEPAKEEPAKTDRNTQIVNTLKDVIVQLLGLIEAEPAKAEDKEDKEKKEKTEEA